MPIHVHLVALEGAENDALQVHVLAGITRNMCAEGNVTVPMTWKEFAIGILTMFCFIGYRWNISAT